MNQLEKTMFKWWGVWNTALANKIRGLALLEATLSAKIFFIDTSSDKIAINCIFSTYQILEKVVTWSHLSRRSKFPVKYIEQRKHI